MAEEEIVRLVGGAVDDSLPTRGDFGLETPLPFVPGFRNGEEVRLITGGVWVLEGGLLGRLIAGLSQDEKKSLLGSFDGVPVPSVGDVMTMSVMITSSGYL